MPISSDTPWGFADAWNAITGIDGWLSADQAQALFDAARAVRPGEWIVEIGSHHGRSTVVMALAKGPQTHLLAIDPWEAPRWGGGEGAEEAFQRNLAAAGVGDAVEVFKGTSVEATHAWHERPIGLLFIDGAHDYPSVIADIDGWTSYVTDGGIVAIHDAFSSKGVTQAIVRRQFANRRFRYIGSRRTLALYRREEMSIPAAAGSVASQSARLVYFIRNGAVKLAIKHKKPAIARALGHKDGDIYPY